MIILGKMYIDKRTNKKIIPIKEIKLIKKHLNEQIVIYTEVYNNLKLLDENVNWYAVTKKDFLTYFIKA